MDGRAPRCAIHQCLVANPNRVEGSRRGFAQSGGGRASFVFQLLSPTCGVSYNKAHTLNITEPLVQFLWDLRRPYAYVVRLRNYRITISVRFVHLLYYDKIFAAADPSGLLDWFTCE